MRGAGRDVNKDHPDNITAKLSMAGKRASVVPLITNPVQTDASSSKQEHPLS